MTSRWLFRRRPISILGRGIAIDRRTHYDVLELDKKASKKEIKDSFYRLSKSHHPDSGGKEETFKRLSEAYRILSDDESRREYDETISILIEEKVTSTYPPPPRRPNNKPPLYPRSKSVPVDLSPERMNAAWELYKDRWSREEERWNELEKQKKEFRQDLEEIRAQMYTTMTEDQRKAFIISMRQYRRPEYYEKFRHTEKHPYSTSNSTSDKDNSSDFRDKCKLGVNEIRRQFKNIKDIYDASEFLGENYRDRRKSVKYDIEENGEEFRISKKTVIIIFSVLAFFLVIDNTYKSDVIERNKLLLEEERKRSPKS